ncbi:MAG: alpha-tubulin suppressor-like RCC1 family protein [Lentimonas sp.]|jgi:alpha-tubulin suppressor-like RCC1 family protein
MKAMIPKFLSFARAFSGSLCFAGIVLMAPANAQEDPTVVLSTGDDFGAVIDASGDLFLWGSIATGVPAGEIQQIESTVGWLDVSVSRTPGASAHILAIQTNGTLWAWGSNARGQVGDTSTVYRVEPYQISPATDWVEVAAGEFHSMARKSNGKVYLWGGNSYGQLGYTPIYNDPNLDIKTSIDSSPFDSNLYISITAGKLHSHAIRVDDINDTTGTLWAWGQNGAAGGNSNGRELGFLINGDQPYGPVNPTQIGSSTGWSDLFGGYDSVYALQNTSSQTGQLWVWGSGALGLGGNSPGGTEATPVRVGSGSNWVSVSTSKSTNKPHTLGLKSDGTLYGWGVNWDQGQLGLLLSDNGARIEENEKKSSPFLLMEGETFLAAGAGEGFSVIIRDDGFMLGAGINEAGQLANGQTNTVGEGQGFFANSGLGKADLQGVGVAVTTQLPWTNPTVSASFSMKNGGTGSITDPFYLSAVLSSTNTYGDGISLEFAPGEAELEVTTTLTAGQSIAEPFSFILPDSIVAGDYYLVVRADTTNLIEETNEDNNAAATEEAYEFYSDLVVSTLNVTPGAFISGDNLPVDIALENIGAGTISAGASFELRLFLSPDQTADNSAAVDLDANPDDELATVYEVVLESDLIPGVPLELDTFNLEIPRMGGSFYFVGAFVDLSDVVQEQTEIVVNNIVVREDGEDNNLSFTDTAAVEVTGIDIPVAIDQDTRLFNITGDGNWFGQNFVFNSDVVGNDDAVQSPSLAVGDSAEFSTDFEDSADVSWETVPYAITFDWKSETSSINNKLIYRVINGSTGGFINEISGITEWTTIQRVVPANARAEWVYEQGAEAVGDAVYVDNLKVTEIDAPDLVIDGVYLPDGASGSYVLLRDRLDVTVNSRNQGTDTAVSDNYVISIYLSKDRTLDRPDALPGTADDILIRQETIVGGIASGDPAANGFSILLDAEIEDGDYYVIGYIDDYSDADGNWLPGVTDETGQIAEFVAPIINFDGEDNNTFVSTSTIEIVVLADLVVSDLNADPDYYIIEDVDTGEPNSMEFDFTIANIGLAAVNSDVLTSILFSKDNVIEPGADYLLLDYNYNGNFGALSDAPANERLISPDKIDFRQDLVVAGYIGSRLFVGVNIDSGNDVPELDEEHNSEYLHSNDFILSEMPLVDGLDLDAATISAYNITVINDEVAPYDLVKIPWVGQTTETFDSYDGVTSVVVGDDETSEFSVNIEPTTGVRVSFWWKVSSQNGETAGNNQRDVLRFSIDGALAVPDIYGTDVEGWRRVEVGLDAGAHALTWSYIKDDQGYEGEDRGWVDALTIVDLPNLTVSGVAADGFPSDTIDTWSVTIENTGAAIAAGTSFDVSVRLLPQGSWLESGSVELLTITDTDGLGLGETRTYDAISEGGALTLPDDLEYAQEFYYVGAYVDWSVQDLLNGQILESDETDNSAVTDLASIQLGLPDLIGRPIVDGGGVTGVDTGGYSFDDDVELTLHLLNTGDGVLAAGSEFEVIIYAASTNSSAALASSETYELDHFTVIIAGDVTPGAALADIDVDTTLPYAIPNGDYYVGAIIDSANAIKEQGPLPSLLRPDDIRADGEANNIFFTAAPDFTVSGISVEEGMDLASGSFDYDGDADWFGRDNGGDPVTADDEQSFMGGDGAQSPVMLSGESAGFSLAIEDSSTVKFDWAANTRSDLNVLSVYVNDEEVRSLTGELDLESAEPFVVPDGATVRWVYSKGASTVGDVAYLDNLQLLPNSLPDLAITDVFYEPFEYVLDRVATFDSFDGDRPNYEKTKNFDIRATAENQGADLTASAGAFSSADIEVRLSVNNVYGDADDVILGSFAQVEGDFSSTNLLSFLGPIQLGDHIEEGFYHVIVRVDSNDRVEEFTESNNLFISAEADVQITRLPNLIIENQDGRDERILIDAVLRFSDIIDVDETQRYNPNSSVRLRFNIQNIGLGDVSGADNFTTQINLRGILRPGDDDDDPYLLLGEDPELSSISTAATSPIILGEFNIQDVLNGRSYDSGLNLVFDGETKDVDIELFLPANLYLLERVAADKSIEDYLWFFEVIVNRDFPIDETDTYNTWWCVDAGTLLGPPSPVDWVTAFNGGDDDGLFGIELASPLTSSGLWQADYGVDVTAPGMLLAYAFNRNPASGDTTGNTFPGSYGIMRVEGETDAEDEDFLSITFDFVALSTDLVYEVQAADEVTFASVDPLLTIDTTIDSYTDLVGPYSLTGEGGLVEKPNVISVHDQGYAARVTVKDIVATTDADRRFIRIVVNTSTETSPVAVETQLNNLVRGEMMANYGVTDANDALPADDLDLDGVSNLVELMYGTNPNDLGDTPAILVSEQSITEDMALAIIAFGDSLSVPTPNIGSADDYDGDTFSNLLELFFGTDPADPLDF